MQIYDFKQIYQELYKKYEIIKHKMGGVDEQIKSLEKEQQNPQIWQDLVRSADISKQLKVLQEKQLNMEKLLSLLSDFEVGISLREESPDDYTEEELSELAKRAEILISSLWIETLLSGECDSGSAVITLHAGAGGEEAQDWAEMLSRMYVRYAERKNFKCTLIETTAGDGAGIKSQTFLVEGDFAYGYLKTEKGVHRLVRLSPFDANNRRHTSFASLEVSPFVENSTNDVKINPGDIKVDTFRSSGAGGQHVNKTESAIRITHIPTGIVVTCQNERSQIQNREMALKLLASKLKELELAEIEKKRLEKLSQNKKIEWGSQIRSYVMHPYSLAKDHRTGFETANVQSVLDGNLQEFINEYLKETSNE